MPFLSTLLQVKIVAKPSVLIAGFFPDCCNRAEHHIVI